MTDDTTLPPGAFIPDPEPGERWGEDDTHVETPDIHRFVAERIGQLPINVDAGEIDYNFNYTNYEPTPLIRAHLFRCILTAIDSYHDLESYLRTHSHVAADLGFEGSTPSDDTLRRVWNACSDDLRRQIRENAEQARSELAYVENDDPEFRRDLRDYHPDPDDLSHEEKVKAIEEIKPVLYDVLEFGRAGNTSYETDELLDIQAAISRENTFVNGELETRREEGEDVPATRSYTRNIKQRDHDEWQDIFENVFDGLIREAQSAGYLDPSEPHEVYIDITIVPFYLNTAAGHPEGVRGGEEKAGTYYGYHHATIAAHDDGRSILLGTRTLPGSEDPAFEDVSPYDVVKYLVNRADQYIDISEVYMDSEFRAAETLSWLDEQGYDFTLQYPKQGDRIKRKLARIEGTHGAADYYVEAANKQVRQDVRLLAEPNWDNLDTDFAFERSQSEGGQLGLEEWGAGDDLQSLSLEDVDERFWKGRRAYVTNKDVPNETEVVREAIESYHDRWRIETKYRVVKHEFLAKTTSRKFEVRKFYWLFACALYNGWVLLDVLLRDEYPDDVPADRPAEPARAFAKRFLTAGDNDGD